ncbi:Xaa-Pro peptidase family protein [Hahella sp. HN01]|uniref:M24 family metallopeptidase n=1 Tax=Hahella sp. HN01 TaxID=2847262 RepID=UPI0020A68748|nr:Xaa-Pro peptidase family protein [Hahella sp. HN01]
MMDNVSGRYFKDAEYQRRRTQVRAGMSTRGLDACLIASPENIYYLTGLDHQGYFASQLLILPSSGQPILITRAMEKATVRDQAPDVLHIGYSDGSEPPPGEDDVAISEDTWSMTMGAPTRDATRKRPSLTPTAAARETVKALHDAGLGKGIIGIDMNSTFLPYSVAEGIMNGVPDAEWRQLDNLVDDVRIVQSPAELELTREAAAISDSMMLSAIATAGPGVNAREIMAAIYDAMFRRGGTYPGFVPLVRSTRTLAHEHGTWEDMALERGDLLFLEMAGCVRRYHAPIGRFVFVGEAPSEAQRVNTICKEAMLAAADAIKPGVRAGDVYETWQAVLDRNNLAHYSRHHCGYSIGIGYPPSWSGSGVPVGLRRNSDLQLREGMTFHLMSWLLNSGIGDAFLSDTVEVTANGCEFLTTVNREVLYR